MKSWARKTFLRFEARLEQRQRWQAEADAARQSLSDWIRVRLNMVKGDGVAPAETAQDVDKTTITLRVHADEKTQWTAKAKAHSAERDLWIATQLDASCAPQPTGVFARPAAPVRPTSSTKKRTQRPARRPTRA